MSEFFCFFLRLTDLNLVTTTSNFTICDNANAINATIYPTGIVTSVNYPQWQSNQNCNRKIIAPHGRIIRIFITDISIEPPNNNNMYLKLFLGIFKMFSPFNLAVKMDF